MNVDSISPGHLKTEDEHRRDICTAGRWSHSRNFVAATDGNISIRLDGSRILATPTAISKGMMTPDDLVITDMRGQRIAGRLKPSSELAMHLLIYRRRPDINAVCHAHPPTATGYAAAGLALNKAIVSEVVLSLGCIPRGSLRHAGHAGADRSAGAAGAPPRRHPVGQSRRGHLRAGPVDGVFSHGDGGAFCTGSSLVTETLGKQALLSGRDVEKFARGARVRYGTTDRRAARRRVSGHGGNGNGRARQHHFALNLRR